MTPPVFSSKACFEHLYHVISDTRFLNREGLGNEIPFFVCPYPVEKTDDMAADRLKLKTKLDRENIKVLDICLYDLCLNLLEKRSLLQRLLSQETQLMKNELRDLLKGVLDPQDYLAPAISEIMAKNAHDVVFLSGIGALHPYVRAHTVLNNLHSRVRDCPLVLFFPGDYRHSEDHGASLNLYGTLPSDQYYRAFNILTYEV